MKKQVFLLILLLFILVSCSQKQNHFQNLNNKAGQEYVFNHFMKNDTPQLFNNLITRHYIEGNRIYFIMEKMYPECSGVYLLNRIYSPAFDSGDWVDSLLINMEETRLGTEIFELLENDLEMKPPIIEEIALENESTDTQADEEKDFIIEGVEKRLLDSYNRLKVMEFESELFIPYEQNNSTILIHGNKNIYTRTFYDEYFRINKKELWNIKSAQDSVLELTETYEYAKSSKLPLKKTMETESKKIVSEYNSNGLVYKANTYKKIEKEIVLSNTTVWDFDEKNRITRETSTDFVSDENKNTTEKKQIFLYNKEDSNIPPDYEYYEGGKLSIKTEYSDKGNYKTTIYFDESNSVTTLYENYKKVRDVYMTNGVTKRVKVYE